MLELIVNTYLEGRIINPNAFTKDLGEGQRFEATIEGYHIYSGVMVQTIYGGKYIWTRHLRVSPVVI